MICCFKHRRGIVLIVGMAFLAVITICGVSCSKKAANANAKFLGTYQGNDCSGSALPNLVVTAGPNSSSISLSLTGGIGGCATVSGNDATFAYQTFNDLCGDVLSVSGSGTLNGNTFTINISGLDSTSGASGSAASNYCFMGTK